MRSNWGIYQITHYLLKDIYFYHHHHPLGGGGVKNSTLKLGGTNMMKGKRKEGKKEEKGIKERKGEEL